MGLIRLTPEAHAFAMQRGRERQAAHKEWGSKTRAPEQKDQGALNVRGALGEVVVCVAFDIDPVGRVRSDKPDKGVDLVAVGIRWSVKATGRSGWNMLLPREQTFDADRAVLVWPTDDGRIFEIVGTASRARFMRLAKVDESLHRPALSLPWQECARAELDLFYPVKWYTKGISA